MTPHLMYRLRLLLLVGLSVMGGALAQNTGPEILPKSAAPAQPAPPLVPLTPVPGEIPPLPSSPVPLRPIPAPNTPPSGTPVLVTPAPLPTTLDRVSASLKAVQSGPSQSSGELTLNLTLLNAQASAVAFSAGRDSSQNCAVAPLVRVLKVGSREVVYPAGEKRICTQEQIIKTALLGGSTVFTRTLNLAPGDYVIESWFQGFAGPTQSRVRLSAPPLRISVK